MNDQAIEVMERPTRVPDRDNPFIGPRPYLQRHKDYFFGRDEEAEHLLALLIATGLVVFYAPSGAGKSSLIKASLIPNLKARDYKVLPVARIGGELPAGISSREVDNIFTFNMLWSLTGFKQDPKRLVDQRLCDFLKHSARKFHSGCRVIIIDQFEEIFTTHPARWEKREDFFVQLQEALRKDSSLLMLLALREDYIAGLDRYAPNFPGRLDCRFRMERLRQESAMEAVVGPIKQWELNHSPQHSIKGGFKSMIFPNGDDREPEVARLLIDNLRRIKTDSGDAAGYDEFIEGVQLQVVCHRFWENVKSEMPRPLTPTDVRKYAKVDEALEEFYESALAKVQQANPEVPQDQIRNWFSGKLITPTGIRAQVYAEKDAGGNTFAGGLPSRVVNSFVDEYLVKAEAARGGWWYELSHDRFIAPILKANRRWMKEQGTRFYNDARAWDEQRRKVADEDYSVAARIYRRFALPIFNSYPKLRGDWAYALVNWYHREKLRSYLYFGPKLVEAEDWARNNPGSVSELELDFITASSKAEAIQVRRQRITSFALAIGLTLLTVACLFALYSRREAAREASKASSGELNAFANLLFPISPERSLLLALESINRLSLVPPDIVQQQGLQMQDTLSRAAQGARLRLALYQDNGILSVAFAPDGNRIAAGDEKGVIILYDAISGDELPRLSQPGAIGKINALAFSPDGRRLASANESKSVLIWNLDKRTEQPLQIRHPDEVFDVAFSPDGKLAATAGSDRTARVFDAASGKIVREFPGHADAVNAVAFGKTSKGELLLATAGNDGLVRIWGLKAGNPIRQFQHRASGGETPAAMKINSICFSAGAGFLAAGGEDGVIKIWDLQNEGVRAIQRLTETDAIKKVAFHLSPYSNQDPDAEGPNMRLVSASRNGIVRIWAGFPLQNLATIFAHKGSARSAAFSPDGKLIATAGSDRGVKIWNATVGHSAPSVDVEFSADGERLATLGADGKVIIWDAASSRPMLDFHAGRSARKLAFDPSAMNLSVAGGEGVRLFNANFGSGVNIVQDIPAMAATYHPSREARRMVSGNANGTILSWELWNEKQSSPQTFVDPELDGRAHENAINDLAFSRDGKFLASAGDDKKVKIWRESGDLVKTFTHNSPVKAVAFSRDGKSAAAACSIFPGEGGKVEIWKQWENCRVNCSIRLMHSDTVNDVAFSNDGKLIATAAADGLATVWNADNGAKVVEFSAHDGSVRAVAFSPDDKLLATVGDDKTMRLHYLDYPSQKLLDMVRPRLTLEWLPEDCTRHLGGNCQQHPVLEGVKALIEGRRLALNDQSPAKPAIEQFQLANKKYPVLNLDPDQEAMTIRSQGKLEKALNRAWFADSEDGGAAFVAEVLEALNSLQNISSEEKQRQMVLLGENLARQRRVEGAIMAFKKGREIHNEPILAVFWNNLCWFGSLWSYPAKIDPYLLFAGEQAVELDPKNVNFQDSRGLARARNGEYDLAIDDLRAYIDFAEKTGQSEDVELRTRFIKILERLKRRPSAGEDPELTRIIKDLRGN